MTEKVESQDFILLGGQVSKKHPAYKDFAQLASFGFPWWLLKTASDPEWQKKPAKEKVLDILYTSGQLEFINNSTELTKLSAIIGDTRMRYSSKRLKDVLGKLRVGTSESSPAAAP